MRFIVFILSVFAFGLLVLADRNPPSSASSTLTTQKGPKPTRKPAVESSNAVHKPVKSSARQADRNKPTGKTQRSDHTRKSTTRETGHSTKVKSNGRKTSEPRHPPTPTSKPSKTKNSANSNGSKPTATNHDKSSHQPGSTTPPIPESQMNIGRFSLTEKPPQCTDAALSYKHDVWVYSGSMYIVDSGAWWGPDHDVDWTFSTNTSNIVFGKPSYIMESEYTPQPKYASKRTKDNEITLAMSGSDARKTLIFNANHVKDDEKNTSKYWDWPEGDRDPPYTKGKAPWLLSIEGKYPCAHPIGDSSCANNTVERTPASWEAYGMNKWFRKLLQDYKDDGSKGPFMQYFQSKYQVGSGSVCSLDAPQCSLVDVCNDLPDHGRGEDAAQVYLAMIAFQNLSDMFNKIYQTLTISELSTLAQISSLAMKFDHVSPIIDPADHSSLATDAGILGAVSGFLSFIPGALPEANILRLLGTGVSSQAYTTSKTLAAGVPGMVGGILGAVNSQLGGDSSYMPDKQYATNQAQISSYLGTYVDGLRTVIEDMYSNLFDEGKGIVEIVGDGGLVNRTDLNIDCTPCLTASQQWMNQYLTLKMINQMWWLNNVFVAYMPYGKVIQVGTEDEKVDFDGQSCWDNFHGQHWPDDDDGAFDDIYGDSGTKQSDIPLMTVCMNQGMARLAWYNPDDPLEKPMNKDGYGQLRLYYPPPGANGTDSSIELNTTGTGSYTFKPTDVVKSSVLSYLASGYDTDGAKGDAQDALKYAVEPGKALNVMKEMFQMKPDSEGMFTLPVMEITDLNIWPTYWSVGDDRTGGDNYCPAMWSRDQNGKKLIDHVSSGLKYIMTHKLGEDNYVEGC